MRYDYQCVNKKCKKVFEVIKRMSDPDPETCPHCRTDGPTRFYSTESLPTVGYTDRPPWTYPEARKFKTATYKGKTYKIDPNRHGDITSWDFPGERTADPRKKRKK